MEEKALAREYFLKGYSCAQSVAAAFAETIGTDAGKILSAVSMFGGGISGLRGVCGAVTGALFALGAAFGLESPEEKPEAYRRGREFIGAFEEKFSSSECKTLLELADAKFGAEPSERDERYYRERPCLRFVEAAAELAGETIEKYR